MSEKKSHINIEVQLDTKNVPDKLFWTAASPEGPMRKESKAMLLSLFDKDSLETFKIDLWTKDLQVAEMDRLMYFTLKGLADTYFNATNNAELANQMRSFVQHFGEFTKILKSE